MQVMQNAGVSEGYIQNDIEPAAGEDMLQDQGEGIELVEEDIMVPVDEPVSDPELTVDLPKSDAPQLQEVMNEAENLGATDVLVKEVEVAPPPQEDLPIADVSQQKPKLLPVPTPSQATAPTQPPIPLPADDGLFYDSEAGIPSSELSKKAAIRNVSPSIEPASKLDIVVKNSSAGSRQSKLVSAERALKLGRYESAIEIYNRLYDQNPRDINVLMGRAIALQRLDRDEAAIQAYQDLLVESPGYTQASVNMYGLVAKRYPSVALRNLMDLHERNPQDVGVLAQMSVIEAHLGRYDSALKYIGIASGYEPNNAGHIYNMAVISDKAGEESKALQYYERALEVDAVYGGNRSVPREAIFARLGQLR